MPDIIKFRRLAKELVSSYLKHQSRKAHDGLFVPMSVESKEVNRQIPTREDGNPKRSLRKLTGVKLSTSDARAVWPSVLEHKWYLGERLGRDVGLRVAAVDYFENIHTPRPRLSFRARSGGVPPRLPMMMPFGQRS
ncbi:MAG: adenylate cyclase [Acidobacteriota bacterium]|jgi:hypothetical protein|nr:adenylate cyclase [Acidobacteriota bacterium]